MKKSILIILFIFVIQSYSQDTLPARYLPLKIGNSWTFDVWRYPEASWYRTRFVITKDTLIENVKYFYFDGFPPDDYYSRYSWIRFDSLSSIISLITVSQSEYDYLNLSANQGDTLLFPCIVRADTSLFGVNTTHKYYYKNINSFHTSITRSIDLAYYFGITYYRYTLSRPEGNVEVRCYLRGCNINGIVYGDTSVVLGVNQVSSKTPESFSLFQNYPNPFNPNTRIRFSVPKSSFTKLTIYDITGRVMAILVNEELKPGVYEVDWDASHRASGVYYYKLETQNFTETQKMVLIK
ncbi:MAG: T9SS type A sorting domain-containing protein [Ignavibacteria bacterium]|nr:T9SS type A sorting domain-containing protein [Ignavibacteria bacterium]